MNSISRHTALVWKVQFWFQFCIYLVVLGWFGSSFLRSIPGTTARSGWVQTPCVIESSEVLGLAGESSKHTARVQVVYRYAFNGRDYEFSRQHLLKGSPATDQRMNAALRRFPRGQKTICYVNPRHPAEAVLERPTAANSFPFGLGSFPFGFGWVQLIPVVGSVIGLVVLWRRGSNQSGKKEATSQGANQAEVVMLPASRSPGGGLDAAATSEPFELTPVKNKLGTVMLSFMALFWNGIVGVFLWAHFSGKFDHSTSPDSMSKGGRLLFLMIFALVGLLLMIGCVSRFLASFNPRPRLKIHGHALAVGDTLDLEWRIEGRVHKLKGLKIVLEGREEARYLRGTTTYTDVNVFARWLIAETTQRDEMRSGRASLVIPPLTVPTFETPNNKILWVIKVQGEIPNWPDLEEAMPLELLPAKTGQTPTLTSASS